MSRVRHSAAKLFSAIAVVMLAASPVGAADPVSPVGRWQTATGESRYEVSFCGGNNLCARLTWLRSDARTPENLAHLNTYVVKGARQTASNKWSGMVKYDGDEYAGRMVLVGNDRMVIKGCQVIFCQSVEFERI